MPTTFAGRALVVAAALAVLPLGAAPGRAAKGPTPEPCPAARYLIAGAPVVSNVTGEEMTGLSIGPQVALDSLCGPIGAKKRRANKKGITQILARWKTCDGLNGPVLLQGKVLAGCGRFQGTLKAKKLKKRKFEATLSVCADGVLDPLGGEECDDGNTVAGDGCEPTCVATPGGTPTTTTPTTASPSSTTLVPTTTIRLPTSTIVIATTTTTTLPLPKTVLGLVLVASPDPVPPSGRVTYQATVTNRGQFEAVQVRVGMAIPVGAASCQAISDGGGTPSGCIAGREVVWTLDRLPVGTSRTLHAVLDIGSLADGTSIIANARADDAAGSPQASAAATVVVATEAPLMLGLAEDADPVRVGDTLEYVLRFGNRGVLARLGTTLALTLPAGVTVTDAGGGATGVPGVVSWDLATLDPGETGERRVRVAVTDLAGADPLVRVAHAVVASGVFEARARVATQVEPATPLGLTMVARPDPVAPSDVVAYELTVTNRGALAAEQVEVRMAVPQGVATCQAFSDGGTTPNSCIPGRDVVWNLGALAAQTSRTVQAVFAVSGAASVPNGTVLGATARAKDAAGRDAHAAVSTVVSTAAGAPLMLGLAEDADPVRVGDTLEYVLRFGNRGVLARLGTTLALTLPAGVTVTDAGGGATGVPGVVSWDLATLDPGETGERRVRVAVTDLAGADPLVRVAHAVVASGVFEARARVATQVEPATPLGLTMVARPDPVAPSDVVAYELTVTNRGALAAEQVEVRMAVPQGVATCQAFSDGGTTPNSCIPGRDVVWNLGALAAQTSRTVQAVFAVSGAASVPNGTVLGATARAKDAAGRDAHAAVSTVVSTAAGAPLMLGLAEDADPVRVGDTLEYVLRFGNRGVLARLGTTLALTLPAGVTVTDAGGGATGVPGVVSWDLATLDPGASGERRVRVAVTDLGASDPLVRVAHAVVASGVFEARARVATQVEPATPLGLTMVARPDPVAPSDVVAYELTVTNRGALAAEQVEVRMAVPQGVATCQAFSDGGTTPNSCIPGRDVVWNLGALAAQTSRTVQAVFAVSGAASVPNGTVLGATARAKDAAGRDAHAAVSTVVSAAAGAPLMLGLAETPDPVLPGAEVRYVLRFGNRGIPARSGTTLALTLPAGVTVTDAGGGATGVPGVVSWNLGTVDGGQTGERAVRVTVNAAEPLVRVAHAVLASGSVEARASVVTQVGASPLVLSMVAQQDPVAPAGLLTYLLTVRNDGPLQAVQAQLRMSIPEGVASCQAISDGGTTPNSCIPGRDVVWNLGTLDEDAEKSVQVTFRVSNATGAPTGTILVGESRVHDAAGSRARAAVSSVVQ